MQTKTWALIGFLVLGAGCLLMAMNPQWFIGPMMHAVLTVVVGFFALVCLVRAFERM